MSSRRLIISGRERVRPVDALSAVGRRLLWCGVYGYMLVAFSQVHADIYKWVDPNGVIHFTNVPNHKGYRLIIRSKPELIRQLGGDEQRYEHLIQSLCKKYGVDTALVKAVIKAESDFNPVAVSSKGAQGLMQLMPETARDLRVSDAFDPEENLEGGISYLRRLLDLFNGNIRLALAAYNAGEQAVISSNYRIPPYPETQNYVAKVLSYIAQYR
ncbi:MAG: lytic transglycosylase domain-containing protein [Desulfobacterota bacterium]|nr:lytic transglycosylase domain-containing protein [Thermodesulfobacteriota bacterium]